MKTAMKQRFLPTLPLLLSLSASGLLAQEPPTKVNKADIVNGLSRKVETTAVKDDLGGLTKSLRPDKEIERNYDVTKNFVSRKKESGTVEKLPFVPIPLLFKANSTELADAASHQNLLQLASALKEMATKEPTARFTVEGHASREGPEEHNLELSRRRSQAILSLLKDPTLGLKGEFLSGQGLGEKHAQAQEEAPEVERAKDRVVRVVKTS